MTEVAQPDGLCPVAVDMWELLAPEAIAVGTLTTATAYAFGQLCELIAERRRYQAQVELDGVMVQPVKVDEETGDRFVFGAPVKHPLIVDIRQIGMRIEANMQRFMLTGLGKSMVPVEPEADAFAEFGGMHAIQGGKA